jgi:hypothetical protein
MSHLHRPLGGHGMADSPSLRRRRTKRAGVVGPEHCDSQGEFDPEREDPGRSAPWPEPSVDP